MTSPPSKLVLGFIGLGVMGQPMALNLLRDGQSLFVWNRSPERADLLEAHGATRVSEPRALAEHCDIVFINVADDAAVKSVLFDHSFAHSGLLNDPTPQQRVRILIDMGTTSPTLTRDLAIRCKALNIDFLDAPVSGGEAGTKAGTLSIMLGGETAAFKEARPYLERLGSNIVHVGASGAGQIAKACNQIVVSATLVGVAEAITFARQQGVDPAKVRAALLGGSAYSRILEIHGQRMLDGNFVPGFRTRLHHKDLGIVSQEAEKAGINLAATELAFQHLSTLMDMGEAELDSAALIHSVENAQNRT